MQGHLALQLRASAGNLIKAQGWYLLNYSVYLIVKTLSSIVLKICYFLTQGSSEDTFYMIYFGHCPLHVVYISTHTTFRQLVYSRNHRSILMHCNSISSPYQPVIQEVLVAHTHCEVGPKDGNRKLQWTFGFLKIRENLDDVGCF